MKIAYIKWRDARMMVHQEPREADFDISIVESVGIVIEEDREKVVIARELVDGDDVRGAIVIPRENIKSYKKLNIK